MKYVWPNLNTGEFSNTWDQKTMDAVGVGEDEATLRKSAQSGWKLIKYECLNDESFEFYNMMKVITNLKP